MQNISDQVQRNFAIEVVKVLRKAGHEALWAGGCVRDALLGKQPKDYDIATDAEPEKVRQLFGRKRTIAVGVSFGVITVLPPRVSKQSEDIKAEPIEVATFRSDGSYVDGRRPNTVRFTNAKEDALRRDFTINGMFYDPIEERVIDYVHGQRDLTSGIVQAIGEPEQRFAEDRLRMLRAIRFAATLQFDLDSDTLKAIQQHADAITEVSSERIGAELKRMLVDSNRSDALLLLRDSGLLSRLLPGLSERIGSNISTISEDLGRLDSPTPAVALAAMLCKVTNHSAAGKIARELKWTNKESERVSWLIENQHALDKAEERPWSEVQPLLAAEGGSELVQLRKAATAQLDAEATDKTDEFCIERLAWPEEKLNPDPLLVGSDLIDAGRRPGPQFKEILSQARADQLDGLVCNKKEAMKRLRIIE